MQELNNTQVSTQATFVRSLLEPGVIGLLSLCNRQTQILSFKNIPETHIFPLMIQLQEFCTTSYPDAKAVLYSADDVDLSDLNYAQPGTSDLTQKWGIHAQILF